MEYIDQPTTLDHVKQLAQNTFGHMIKGVIDLKKQAIVLDAELHADQEAYLLEHGSQQSDLWGFNLYPDLPKADWIEYDSMINIRPSQNNLSRTVQDPAIQTQIKQLIDKLIPR